MESVPADPPHAKDGPPLVAEVSLKRISNQWVDARLNRAARSHAARILSIDRPIAALIGDLKQRGLLDETLVIWAGEFGRSPDNGLRGGMRTAGRDHNAGAMAIWFAGGGVAAGHEIGATDEIGEKAVECVHPLKDLHVTILHLMGLDDGKLRFFHEGRFKQISQTGGQVIRELLA